MANIRLEHLKKIYKGNKNYTVIDFNLEIKDKEFVVLVGGSGCGKSTTLRMIAGLEDISDGTLYFDDEVMNEIPTGKRNIAMVFQSYALYPHMNVFNNIAFPLVIKNRLKMQIKANIKELKENCKNEIKIIKESNAEKADIIKKTDDIKQKYNEKIESLKDKLQTENQARKEQIKVRVEKVAKIVGLDTLLHRKPKQLSGGQRQRVALARAIVKDNIKVLLMDEPLSNLDAKLRVEMRSSIIKLHEELGLTIIYVTHDQVEAMTMGDRIVVMNSGIAQQVGSPKEIYEYPENLFVASFIGTPSMNFFKGTISKNGLFVIDEKVSMKIPDEQFKNMTEKGYSNKEVVLGIRPGDILVDTECAVFKGEVEVSELLGDDYNLHIIVGPYRTVVKTKASRLIKNHDMIGMHFELEKAHFFDLETQKRIRGAYENK